MDFSTQGMINRLGFAGSNQAPYQPYAPLTQTAYDRAAGIQPPSGGGANAGGSVAAGPSPAEVAARQAAAAEAAQKRQAVDAINAGYGQVTGVYDRMLANLPNQQKLSEQRVNTMYDSQVKSAKSGYERGSNNLNVAQGQLDTTTKKGLRDLASNIRNTFSSWDTMLGAQGAGDSSATGPNGQLSYALHKVESQNRSDILQGYNEQQTQLGLKRSELDSEFNDQIQQLNAWKSEQVLSIAQQIAQQRDQLDAQRANANKDKLIAIANADAALVKQAVAALGQVESTHKAALSNINNSISRVSTDVAKMADTNFNVQKPQGAGIPQLAYGGGPAEAGVAPMSAPYRKNPWEF